MILVAKIQIRYYEGQLLFVNLVRLQCPVIQQNVNLGVAVKCHFIDVI